MHQAGILLFEKISYKSVLDILLFVSAPSCWEPWVQARRLQPFLGAGEEAAALVPFIACCRGFKIAKILLICNDHLAAVAWEQISLEFS